MKFNWGTGIVAVLILFASLMSFMVYKSTQQRFDLVSENYYEEEMAYQQIIDQRSNAAALKGKADLSLKNEAIYLQLPEDLIGKPKSISTLMYFELDARKDFTWEEKHITLNKFKIPFESFDNGKWIAKVKVNCEGVDYYFEPEIIL